MPGIANFEVSNMSNGDIIGLKRESLLHSSLTSDETRKHLATSKAQGHCAKPMPSSTDVLSISHYIPIGTIKIAADSSASKDTAFSPVWRELTLHAEDDLRVILALPPYLKSLVEARWIRLVAADPGSSDGFLLRIYVLPIDAGNRTIDRSYNYQTLLAAMRQLLPNVDVSKEAWAGRHESVGLQPFNCWATKDDRSLFYTFNTLPSPRCDLPTLSTCDRFSIAAIEDLISDDHFVPGLQTKLYPFQARAVAAMVSRESNRTLNLDPRFERRASPDGVHMFYYNPRAISFSKEPCLIEATPCGILAETMGLGKTLMCISVILTTQFHLPRLPPQHAVVTHAPLRGARSLTSLTARVLKKNAIPGESCLLRSHNFDRTSVNFDSNLRRLLHYEQVEYLIEHNPERWTRRSRPPPPTKKRICYGTIVVVPRNLLSQWQSEITKHAAPGALRVLVMDNSQKPLPEADELSTYDLVLFSKTRFEQEARHGVDSKGRSASYIPTTCRCPYIGSSRERDCTCLSTDDLYSSPLKDLHWLRIIIDEGHQFTSKDSRAVQVAIKLVTADRRWIVSGTPAKDNLWGLDVDLAAHTEEETASPADRDRSDSAIQRSVQGSRNKRLRKRRRFNKAKDVVAASHIGSLATNFLQAQPWARSSFSDGAEWDEHIYCHESFFKRSYSAFSPSLSRTLESLVIKTRPEDVDRDLQLPPLEHKVVRLEPSFFDKLTINLFLLVVTSNAILSERTGPDYLFGQNKKSIQARYDLVAHLRQSAFCWTGFSEDDIQSTIDRAVKYLGAPESDCSFTDYATLAQYVEFASQTLTSESWKALSASHEIGLFVESWPECGTMCSWDLVGVDEDMPMVGLTPLIQAQNLMNSQLFNEDPLTNFSAAGTTAVAEARSAREDHEKKAKKPSGSLTTANEVAGSSLTALATSAILAPPVKSKTLKTSKATTSDKKEVSPKTGSPVKRKRAPSIDNRELPVSSLIAKTSIIGTTSSKLSYLLSRIEALNQSEKILVFFDCDNTAFYIAQCLEILHIKHLIYSGKINNEVRSEYIVTFDLDSSVRVLLLDIHCAALGLTINAASRIFFINPPCRPQYEVQATKRCHRIGQTKPVYVETLILKGTFEEALFERSRRMTEEEHKEARHLEDDGGISSIIQNSKMVPVSIEKSRRRDQIARFEDGLKIQVFGRKGRGDMKIAGIDLDEDGKEHGRKRQRSKLHSKAQKHVPRGENASLVLSSSVKPAAVIIPGGEERPNEAVLMTSPPETTLVSTQTSIFG